MDEISPIFGVLLGSDREPLGGQVSLKIWRGDESIEAQCWTPKSKLRLKKPDRCARNYRGPRRGEREALLRVAISYVLATEGRSRKGQGYL